MMRTYRPFLIYNPNKGWAFYPNRQVTNLTYKSIGSPSSRRVMRQPVGWFTAPELAIRFERVAARIN